MRITMIVAGRENFWELSNYLVEKKSMFLGIIFSEKIQQKFVGFCSNEKDVQRFY